MNNDKVVDTLHAFLEPRLDASAANFLSTCRTDINAGVSEAQFTQRIALASRYAKRVPLNPTEDERNAAAGVLSGWDPVEWNLLEALRVALILSRPDLADESFARAFEHSFKYADEGEACAYYRAIALLPNPERFVWRAGEGCRSNMTSVFCAVACENPFPVTFFDDVAWQQLLVKALFIGVSLHRIYGFEKRLSATLATMALDYIDERNSAGRSVPADAWLLLAGHWNQRADRALDRVLTEGRSDACATATALGHAGQKQRLLQWQEAESDPSVLHAITEALIAIEGSKYPNSSLESKPYAVL